MPDQEPLDMESLKAQLEKKEDEFREMEAHDMMNEYASVETIVKAERLKTEISELRKLLMLE